MTFFGVGMRIRLFIMVLVAALFCAVPAYADAVEGVRPDPIQTTSVEAGATPAQRDTSGMVDVTDGQSAPAPIEVAPTVRGADSTDQTVSPESVPDAPSSGTTEAVEKLESDVLEAQDARANYAATHQNMYRLYNSHTGEHLFTTDFHEAIVNAEYGWQYEGIGWVSPTSGTPVYRLYNPYSGDHHYTMDLNEYQTLAKMGWKQEGIGWYSDAADQIAVYRNFNPYERVGTHHYTTDRNEYVTLGSYGWHQEGYAWYATRGETIPITPRYLTTAAWGTRTTYWIGADGFIAKSRLITTDEGANYCAYANADGSFATGQVDGSDGAHYLAAANGMLAPMLSAIVRIDAQDGITQKLTSAVGNNAMCLFLPSYAALANVALSAKTIDGHAASVYLSGAGIGVNVGTNTVANLSGLEPALKSSGQVMLKMRYGGVDYRFAIMKSSAIDALYVTSVDANQDRAFVEASKDHSAKAKVKISLIDAQGRRLYNADSSSKASTIKGRGNSTWGFGNKKPYQISLSKKWDLLSGTSGGDDAQKKWVLLANANDATMLHTPIGYDMGLELGLPGTQGKFVDLFYDGEYRGTYYLCEKVEIKPGRVDIHDLEGDIEDANADADFDKLPTATAKNRFGMTYQYVQGVANPADITGGYLLELDTAYYAKETCWFSTSVGAFVVKSPEFCSRECMIYISEYVQTALDQLANDIFNTGASFDLDSLAKTYLVSEFFKNIDAFCSSTYFYKDKGDTPLVAAPLWDFDSSMGVRTDWPNNALRKYAGFTSPHAGWVIKSTKLVNAVKSLYVSTFAPLMKQVVLGGTGAVGPKGHLHSLAYYRSQAARSQLMNETRFGLTSFPNEFDPFASYDANVLYLRNWLTYRTQWWDGSYAKLAPSHAYDPASVYNGVDYSDVYDYDYYVAQNPDVAATYGKDYEAALWHFVTYGMSEGRIASRNFNVWKYKSAYADLRAAFGNNTAAYYRHFMDYGFYEGRFV